MIIRFQRLVESTMALGSDGEKKYTLAWLSKFPL